MWNFYFEFGLYKHYFHFPSKYTIEQCFTIESTLDSVKERRLYFESSISSLINYFHFPSKKNTTYML